MEHAGETLFEIARDLDIEIPPKQQTPVKAGRVTRVQERLATSAAEIATVPPAKDDLCYLHTVLCQVGMPRKPTKERRFERTNGRASILLTAGELWNGREWIQQPLPSGPKPRIIFIGLTTEAEKTGKCEIDVGRSMHEFMIRLGVNDGGREYAPFRRELYALSVCRMQLGGWSKGRAINIPSTQPIKRFEVLMPRNKRQQTLWPGVVELSSVFVDSVREYAVPHDFRAIAALSHTALGLDIYSWLTQRLCRITGREGIHLTWEALKDQFGHEYHGRYALYDFRKKFQIALAQVRDQYRAARIEEPTEWEGQKFSGLVLYQSPPPVPPKVTITVL